jgi:putative membrane protein
MNPIIQGIIAGFVIVLPGMSGGTVFVILGIYEDMVKDLNRLNFKPYLPMLAGILAGIFLGGMGFAFIFQTYRDATAAFLLGGLIASIRAVLANCPKIDLKHFMYALVGLGVGFYTVGEPVNIMTAGEDVSTMALFVGGALSSAAMIIPGVPGSSVLIIMGIYDSMLFYIKELAMGKLLIFGAGSLAGIFLLLNLLEKLYEKHRSLVSYFFTGLILGSARALLPHSLSFSVALLFILGFAAVWHWGGKS